jgi:hypothetical protein
MTHNQPKQVSPGCSLAIGLAFGGIFALVGAYIVSISLGLLPSNPDNFKAPRLVVAVAGMVFFLAGVWVAFQSGLGAWGADTPFAKWMQYILVLVIMTLFASIFIWVGFGPGERSFQTSTSIGPVTTSGTGSEGEGRCVFGGFGVLAGFATLVYAVRQGMKLLNGGQARAERSRSAAGPARTDDDKLE